MQRREAKDAKELDKLAKLAAKVCCQAAAVVACAVTRDSVQMIVDVGGAAGVDVQKGEGSAAVDARRKELAAQRAAAGSRGAKQFYRVTVRVQLVAATSRVPRWLQAGSQSN